MNMKKSLVFTLALVILALSSRLIPHWPNFTAMLAVAFSGGLLFGKRIEAVLLPLLILVLGDIVINNTLYYDGSFTWLTSGFGYIYGSYLLIALLGVLAQSSTKTIKAIGLVSASVLFYLITNFGVWLGNPMYSQDLGGLINSYVLGLPFLLNSALASLFYGAIIYFAYDYYHQSAWAKEQQA